MGTYFTIQKSDLLLIEQKVRARQKRIYWVIFFIIICCLIATIPVHNTKLSLDIFLSLALLPAGIAFYPYMIKRMLLRNVFYGLEQADGNIIKFTLFDTLWHNGKTVTASIESIIIDEHPLQKRLFNSFLLNRIFINSKKYYIFNAILNKSGIMGMTDNKKAL